MNPASEPSGPLLPELPPLPPADPEAPIDPAWDLGRIAKHYREEVGRLLAERHAAGGSGRDVVRLHTTLMDRFVAYVFTAATRLYTRRHMSLHQRCGVFALGGYGRRELSPYSDIDLLFLYDWKITPYAETVWERLYYSLMDAGWKVGHAVRNVRECLRHANRDFEVRTSLLDGRFICGDASLAEEFGAAVARDVVGKRSAAFFEAKARESRTRHHRHGDSLYLLEPDVKDGCGGLRDLHTAWWLAKVKFKLADLRDLIVKGVVPETGLADVEAARDFLWRVRNGLHLMDGAERNVLSFEHQDRLAPALGFADATDLMRCYYRHVTAVHEFATWMFERCVTPSRLVNFWQRPRGRNIRAGVRIVDRTLHVTDPGILVRDPRNLVTVFHDAQRHDVAVSRETKGAMRDAVTRLPADTAARPDVRDAVLAILSWKQRVAPTLRAMHEAGVLEWLLPEFGHLRWRTQRDLYHVYAIDEHTLHGVAELERLRDGAFRDTLPLPTQVMREIDRVDLLFLALLYHDVGKGFGVEHSARSAELVDAAARRWQLPPDDAHEWKLLVEHHLSMSYIAQRRDLSDDAQIADFARVVENPDCLKRLYLLTFADMKAVGPKVWNSWKAGLLGELYLYTLERFERGASEEEERATRLQRRKDRIRAALAPAASEAEVTRFLHDMPDRYFLTTPQDAAPGHFRLMAGYERTLADAAGETYRAELTHVPEQEYSELTLITHDRPGLFSMLAGVFATSRLNVSRAHIATSRTGIALDVFRLSHLDRQDATLSPDTWARFYQRLHAVLSGEQTVEDLLQGVRRPTYRKRVPARLRTEVTLDNATSAHYTLVDVSALDRGGLLFDVTHTLFQLGLVIHSAKITTNVDQVLDVFYVTDSAGAKVADPDRVTDALSARLHSAEDAA